GNAHRRIQKLVGADEQVHERTGGIEKNKNREGLLQKRSREEITPGVNECGHSASNRTAVARKSATINQATAAATAVAKQAMPANPPSVSPLIPNRVNRYAARQAAAANAKGFHS